MTYSTPGPSRSVMFPADFFDRPAYRRLARKWPLALAWWMRLVLVAREALFKGQLLVGGQPLSLEDLVEVDPAGIDPDFLAALVAEGWLVGDDDALAIARWSEWYRPPSRMPEAEAERSKTRRDAAKSDSTEERPEADRSPTVADRSPTVADRRRPHPAEPSLQPSAEPVRSDPKPSSSSNPGTKPTTREKPKAVLNGSAVSPLPGLNSEALARVEQVYQAATNPRGP